MSDAIFIAIGATGVAAITLGVVTWMLILPARLARSARNRCEPIEPPLDRVATLLNKRAAAVAEEEAGAYRGELLEPGALREALDRASAATAAAGDRDAPARDRRRRLAGVLRAVVKERTAGLRDPDEASKAAAAAEGPTPATEKSAAATEDNTLATEGTAAARAAEATEATADLEATLAALDTPPPPLDPDTTPSLSASQWDAWVAAPSLDPRRSALAALLSFEVLSWQADLPERYGLSSRQRAERLSAPPRITQLGPAVARILQVPTPLFYVAPERAERLIHVNLSLGGKLTPGVVVGREALAFEDTEPVLWFMLGRKLAFLRPEHRLCTVADGAADLRALHLAVAEILDPGTLPEAPDPLLGQSKPLALGKLRQYLLEAERATAARRVLRALAEGSGEQDAASEASWAQWLLASAETSFRSGLLLSGHLGAALRMLDFDDLTSGAPSPSGGYRHALYHYYLSDAYAEARLWLAGAGGSSDSPGMASP